MDRPSLYDDDIVTWAEEQAAAMRALAARSDLSNAIDWENVIEEIESVGRADIERVESAFLQLLIHVLKYASAPGAQSTISWRKEVLVFQASARRNYRRSMRQRIDWIELWASAKKISDSSLKMFGDTLLGGLPDRMPFTPEEMTAPGFDMDAALERLATVLNSDPGHT
ncbi:DUF29 family protein [Methylobacterium sp. NEAU K]|uniref:DUF29 family protein n=1 Tax=Methylobacterium sp. NEAU K TaxID=3064946 RepID=UPI002736A72F|nr:DUF29 family protein [Methylobacterium sp. NEAU K]MDP4002786.1 DUF29 family protein [Methylobacterium sp. NEAU K]